MREKRGEEMSAEFLLVISFILVVFLTRRKISRHGTDGFTSPPKVVVLHIFIALKINCPRPGFNPRILGPMASIPPLHHRGRHEMIMCRIRIDCEIKARKFFIIIYKV
jgi:hypothetical protein